MWCNDEDDVLIKEIKRQETIIGTENDNHYKISDMVIYTERSPQVLVLTAGKVADPEDYEDQVQHG